MPMGRETATVMTGRIPTSPGMTTAGRRRPQERAAQVSRPSTNSCTRLAAAAEAGEAGGSGALPVSSSVTLVLLRAGRMTEAKEAKIAAREALESKIP